MDDIAQPYVTKPRVLVHPGLPPHLSKPEDDSNVYPASTIDVVKVLKAEGFEVVFSAGERDRLAVTHLAAEVWLPILEFTAAVIAGAGGNLLSQIIERLFKSDDEDQVVHLKWKVSSKDRTETFSYDGPSKGAAAAAKRFEKRLSRKHGDVHKR